MPEKKDGLGRLWNEDRDAKRVAVVMVFALAFGALLVALGATSWPSTFQGLLWAAACSSVGWFLGFLFGIPRSLSTDTARTTPLPAPGDPVAPSGDPLPKAAAAGGAEGQMANNQPDGQEADTPRPRPASPAPSTAVNTNLEQISDWLTKIIVGVTLVESKAVLGHLTEAAHMIAGSLGGDASMSFGCAILIYFSFTGLLGSYLLTRLFLQRAFTTAANGTDEGDR